MIPPAKFSLQSAHLANIFRVLLPALFLVLALHAQPAMAQGVLRLLPDDAVSDRTVTVNGRPLNYTATAGTLSLYDQSGEKSAAIFYTAYVAKDRDSSKRPVTFAFNGGPGAASVYLHLGLAGRC